MHIMTVHGWKPLIPAKFNKSVHVPSMLEVIGIDARYDGIKAFADYANGPGHGYYYHYHADGTHSQRQI